MKDFLISEYAGKSLVPEESDEEATPMKIYDLKDFKKSDSFRITKTGDREITITGERIEQIVRMTDMKNFEAVARVYDIMEKLHILTKVHAMLRANIEEYFFEGTDDGDFGKIIIAERVFPLERTIFQKKTKG